MKPCRLALASLAIFCLFGGNLRADPTPGVVSFWPLDEIDGITTPDFASSNVLNITGNIALVPGVTAFTNTWSSNAFSFPGVPLSYFSTAGGPTPVGLPIYKSPGGYTVSMWVNAAPQTARYLYTEGSSSSATPILLIQTGNAAGSNNKLDVLVRNDGNTALLNHVVSSNAVFDSTWHHIAWTDNHGRCVMYVDGKTNGVFTYTPAGTFTLNITTIGALVRTTVATNSFTGLMDNVAVWSRALSQAEVQDFMSNSIPLPIVQSKPVVQSISPASTNALGDYLTLSATAIGSQPISVQWYSNNVALPNQTNFTLVQTALTTPGTITYTLILTNVLGFSSNNVSVTVLPDPPVNISAGLISYWPLDTVSNITDTNDIVIAGTTPDLYSHEDFALLRASSFANFPTLTSGEFSNALAFDASQTNVATTGGGVPIFNYTNYSVSMWLNGQPQPQLRVFSNSSTNNGNPLFTIGTETSGFFPYASIFIRNDAGTVMINNLSSSNFVFDGNWHHVVWVDQNGYGLLYIDGVLDPVSFSYTRSGTFTMNTTTIGGIVRGTVGNCFSGNIDDVAVWNRRLTYSEIQSLQTNPPPAPTQILPPGIVSLTTSADPTNNTYIGDTFSLTVQATGTAPLNYQWLLNGQPISAGTNATATNSIFVLSPAQATDSGAYSVVVSNSDPILPGGGSVTSTVVQVTVQTFTPITNGVALSLDVDAVGTTNTQPGFQMYNTSLAGSAFNNGIRVNISGVGTALADRVRTTSPNVTNGPGMTQAQIYNDFIFANSTNGGTGLNIALSHLVPSTPYAVTIWSFDAVSTGPRNSTWAELSSGTPIPMTNYTFNGSVLPLADYDDTIRAVLTTSTNGTLLIQGLTVANGNFGTFVNGLKLVPNVGPSVSITGFGTALDGNLQVTAQGQYNNQPIGYQYSLDLSPGSWKPVLNGMVITNIGSTEVFEIPITTNQQFFRAVGH